MAAYSLTRAAADDLADIHYHGLEMFGRQQADDYLDGLEATFRFLAAYPRAARLREETRNKVRAHPYKAHLIVCKQVDDDHIVILRIRSGREDWINE